jgi:hypothetical protein
VFALELALMLVVLAPTVAVTLALIAVGLVFELLIRSVRARPRGRRTDKTLFRQLCTSEFTRLAVAGRLEACYPAALQGSGLRVVLAYVTQ